MSSFALFTCEVQDNGLLPVQQPKTLFLQILFFIKLLHSLFSLLLDVDSGYKINMDINGVTAYLKAQ